MAGNIRTVSLRPDAYRVRRAFCLSLRAELFGILGGTPVALVSLRGLAGLIELVGGLLIAVGFLTRYAAFIASGEMAVAYFLAHVPRGFWPIQNNGELTFHRI